MEQVTGRAIMSASKLDYNCDYSAWYHGAYEDLVPS